MRNTPLKGLLRKSSPATNNPSVSDSTRRGNIQSNVRILSDKEVAKKNKKPKLEKYVPGVDGPKVLGGSAPNPAKAAYQIGSTLFKGGKYLYNKIKG
tara:strand:+ start:490 stop:780 length:291 start_codon:yes stop_codon:yes gene_type:complete